MIAPLFKQKARPYLSGEKPTFATVLLSILLQAYGIEVLQWDGATIQMETKRDFDVEIPRRVYDQLMALITAITTDTVYTDVETFDEICNALVRKGLGTYKGVPPALDVAWAVNELNMADPEPVGRIHKRYSPEIRAYMRVVLDDEGISFAPKSMPMAESKAPTTSDTEDPTMFAGAWTEKQAASDEIDQQVNELTKKMLEQLADIGIQATVNGPKEKAQSTGNPTRDAMNRARAREKRAEWTSPENEAVHTEKHWYEFGSPEAYAAAEAEHASGPAGDEVPKDVRCKIGPNNEPDCTMAFQSASRGTLHVKRLKDGKTVTLYKKPA